MKKFRPLPVLVVCALAFAQEPARDTIRTTTRLVQLDVVAVDKKGQPVRDLTREDFEVREEGKPQPIRVFVMVAGDAPLNEAEAATEPVTPGVFTNRVTPPPGKTMPSAITMVLFDALNTRFTDRSAAREQVLEVIDGLKPNERVALFGLGSQLVMLQDFTQEPALLRTALEDYGGPESKELRVTDPDKSGIGNRESKADDFFRIMTQTQKEIDLYERAEQTLLALEAIANHVAKLPGRKNLVWVSAAFPVSLGVSVGSLMTPPTGPGSQAPEYNPSHPVQHLFTRAMRSLNDANVAVYPVDARGVVGDYEGGVIVGTPRGKTWSNTRTDGEGTTASNTRELSPARIDPIETMKNVAEDTGGVPFYNTNDLRKAVRRAIDDSSVSYTIGFYPKLDAWDGRFRRLALKVERPGVTLRYRRGYFAYSEPVSDEKFRQATMRDLALSPLEARAIRLTARLGEQVEVGKFRVALEVQPTDMVLRRDGDRWLGALDVLGLVRGADGKPLWADLGKVDLSLDDKGYEALLRDRLRFTSTISLPAGAHEVRLVVRDWNSGAAGSLHVPATAFFPAGQKAETIAEKEKP